MTNTPKEAYSVEDFCKSYSISRALFYKLDAQNKAPKSIKVGAKRLILANAIPDWVELMSKQ